MKLKKHLYLIITFVLLLTALETKAQDKEISAIFCKLPVTKEVNKSNSYFTDIYRFQLSKDNKPINVKNHRSKHTQIEDVNYCLSKWKFKGFTKSDRFLIYFKWEHAVGWVQIRVVSNKFSKEITPEKNCSNK